MASPASLAFAPPAFLAADLSRGDEGSDPVLRAMERELPRQQPQQHQQQRQDYFCAQCIAKCDSGWDIIAGPHTGHSCLPLSVALQVLPSALSRQVASGLRHWQESFEKPRAAVARQLEEQTRSLREQRRQKRQALARVLTELAETERELASSMQARAVAACNWHYQRKRMLRQLGLWREGCGRLAAAVSERQQEAPTEAWAHGWSAATRELSTLAALLDERMRAWAEEEASIRDAVQQLRANPPNNEEEEEEREEEIVARHVKGRVEGQTLTLPFGGDKADGGRDATSRSPLPEVVAAAALRHHYPSLNEFAVLEQQQTQRQAACEPHAPLAAADNVLGDDDDDDVARTARQQRLAAKQTALQRALQQLLGANPEPRTPAPTTSPPPPQPSPARDGQEHTQHGQHGQPTLEEPRSKSSSLASLQEQLLKELQREALLERAHDR